MNPNSKNGVGVYEALRLHLFQTCSYFPSKQTRRKKMIRLVLQEKERLTSLYNLQSKWKSERAVGSWSLTKLRTSHQKDFLVLFDRKLGFTCNSSYVPHVTCPLPFILFLKKSNLLLLIFKNFFKYKIFKTH